MTVMTMQVVKTMLHAQLFIGTLDYISRSIINGIVLSNGAINEQTKSR